MGNPPNELNTGRGDTWETQMGTTQAEATHGKPGSGLTMQGRHMGNPNGLAKAEATHGKPKASLSFNFCFEDVVCASEM